MPEDASVSPDGPDATAPAGGRLDSWKEIAGYLKRDVTTVRRWEKREGLPVHRHLHERRDTVYAFVAEIDDWWQRRRNQLTPAEAPGIAPDHQRRFRIAPSVLTAAFAITTLVLAVALTQQRFPDTPEDTVVRFAVFPPGETSFGSVSLAPDGRQLAFTAVAHDDPAGKTLLWVRPLDSLTARPLPDTEGAAYPFWSPAGDALGFFAGGNLWVVSTSGGAPRLVHAAPDARGGTWNRDGVIVFAPGREGALLRVAAGGGASAPVTSVDRPGERGHLWPEFLPDGRHFLYLADAGTTRPEDHHLFVAALDGSDKRPLFSVASSVTYSSHGYLVFERARQVLAQRFSASRLELTGDPVLLADRVQPQPDHKVDVSVAGGTLVYRTMQSPATRLVWHDRSAGSSALVREPAEYYEPTLSPDGRRVAVDLFDPRPSLRFGDGVVGVRSDIWILDRTGAGTQFTTDPAADWGPVWSPDGRPLVFSSNRRGSLELFEKDATDRQAPETPLPSTGTRPVAHSWSSDGRFLLYSASDPAAHRDLWLLPMTGARQPRPLMSTAANEREGQISPDGRWLAYTSDESGRDEVYVQRFPEPASKRRVSANGGADPRWRPDGTELYFVSPGRQLMAVSITAGGTFEPGSAVPLFDIGMPPRWYGARNLYDAGRDGRFVVMAPVEGEWSSPLTVVVNWDAELKKPPPAP